MTDKSLAVKIVATGAVISSVTGMLLAWETRGWITREAYAQDHMQGTVEQELHAQEVTNSKILSLLEEVKSTQETIIGEQKKNQDQWECDETDEELKELLDKKDKAGGYLSPTDLRREAKGEEVWRTLRCTRFVD